MQRAEFQRAFEILAMVNTPEYERWREEKVDIVRKFQRLLRRTPDSTKTLLRKSLQELERLETELEQLLLPDPMTDGNGDSRFYAVPY